MATLTIRNLDDQVKQQIRVQAAEHNRSMEAEARAILAEATSGSSTEAAPLTIAERFRRFREIVEANGVFVNDEFDDVRSHDMPRAADFGWAE